MSYLMLKSLHLFGVILFMGNIIVTGWWKYMADRTRDEKIIAFAQRQVILTDYIFTLGGAVILLVCGELMARLYFGDDGSTHWLMWARGLFVGSGVIWLAVLIPVQIKQARMVRHFKPGEPIPEEYWRLSRLWIVWGTVAVLLPLGNLYWMVFKPV